MLASPGRHIGYCKVGTYFPQSLSTGFVANNRFQVFHKSLPRQELTLRWSSPLLSTSTRKFRDVCFDFIVIHGQLGLLHVAGLLPWQKIMIIKTFNVLINRQSFGFFSTQNYRHAKTLNKKEKKEKKIHMENSSNHFSNTFIQHLQNQLGKQDLSGQSKKKWQKTRGNVEYPQAHTHTR